MGWHDSRSQLPAHTPGAPRGEELVRKLGREAGRENSKLGRTARDATSINPDRTRNAAVETSASLFLIARLNARLVDAFPSAERNAKATHDTDAIV